MSLYNFLIFISMFPIFTVLSALTPYYTRRTECFGISIPEKEYFSDPLKSYRKQFAVWNITIGLLFTIAAAIWYTLSVTTSYWVIFGLLVQIAIGFLLYLHFHRLVKALKESSAWKNDVDQTITVDLTSERNDYISSAWLLVLPAIILATLILGFAFYPNIPAQLPIHYNSAGMVDRYVRKSYAILFFAPLMQVFLSIVFILIFYVAKSRRRRIDPLNEDESIRKDQIFRKNMGWFVIIEGAFVMLTMTCTELMMIGLINSQLFGIIMIVLFVLICAYAIIISIMVGQGGSRVKRRKFTADRLSLKDSDSYWKLGVFYVNPNDPAIFVEKRFGIGYTLNFGRGSTYALIVGFILLMVALVVACNYLF